MLSDTDETHYSPKIRQIEIEKTAQNCGFKLTRSKWDPYPWVISVDPDTPAQIAGLKPGDCILEVNGEDVIGQKISEIAEIVKLDNKVSLLSWNAGVDSDCTPETMCCGPMPTNLQRLSACMSTILAFLECPVCLDTILPPSYQCENGHLICMRCRTRSERCPICRLRYGRGRSLVADQVYNSLVDAFHLQENSPDNRKAKIQELFKYKNKTKTVPNIKVTLEHTNNFLAKIIGKSNSVNNLSNNQISTDCNLKTKSLSTQEIFQDETSSAFLRTNSVTRLSRNEKNKNYLTPNKSISCHTSFESLNCCSNLEEPILFHCPFASDCATLIKGEFPIEHFQVIHKGPLIQYFTPHLTIKYSKISKEQDLSYILLVEKNTFFLKIETSNKNVSLWTWMLGTQNKAKYYQMKLKVFSALSTESILTATSNVFPLSSVSYQDIKKFQKEILIGISVLEKCEIKKDDIIIEVNILKNDLI